VRRVNVQAGRDVEQTMTRDRSTLLHRAAVAAGAVCVLGLTSGLLPAGAQSDGAGSSEDRIDVLTASRDELRAELAELEQRYATQREQVERARQAARDAEAAALAADARVEQAKADLEAARGVVASYAVEAYMRPPAADTLRVLSLSDADDAGFAHSVMEIMTEDRQQVVDELVAQQQVVEREEAAAETAADEARSAASAAEVQLVELDRMRAEQQELAADMDERLDDALAEAAALAAIDQAASEALVADEVALRTQGPATPAAPPVSSAGGSSAPVPAPSTSTAPPSSGGATPTTARPAPTTTRAPATTAPPSSGGGVPSTGVTWADVTNVGGIYVHTSIANNVRNLLNAATAAGFSLRGGGYRDPAAQIATRRANCGPTYYDIYEKPSSQCTPPTARPGRSMHERGLAIDFTSAGRLITTRSDPAFVWLSNNAARFGLFNLPSEPWHWSINGT
jgi:peptidoglycan hydrolase CwlO-like protein